MAKAWPNVTRRLLGAMYHEGQGVAQCYKKALAWFRKSADQGNVQAQCQLGIMYDHGQGVAQCYKEALAWYRKAADQGHARAQFNMGVMYHNGQGVPENYKKALSWYRMAAAQEHPGAQELVAKLEAINSPAGMAITQCANCGALEAPRGAALEAVFKVQSCRLLRKGVPNKALEGAGWA
eukprot:CAMPEP_0172652140 /NCGR_PEP_ID=MMETSP1068-20121228/243165_1 /TAXON_ID=35684 /ORGANISM="Pseudopedinella elastica, Strain CCMP716" /LENGTH=179 /DNA_ID=CAMNT_0013466545 /DNA_START=341 /DNA_END=879 /DNA_ORIENTATION=-